MDVIFDYPLGSEVAMQNDGRKSMEFASCMELVTECLSLVDIALVVNRSGGKDSMSLLGSCAKSTRM